MWNLHLSKNPTWILTHEHFIPSLWKTPRILSKSRASSLLWLNKMVWVQKRNYIYSQVSYQRTSFPRFLVSPYVSLIYSDLSISSIRFESRCLLVLLQPDLQGTMVTGHHWDQEYRQMCFGHIKSNSRRGNPKILQVQGGKAPRPPQWAATRFYASYQLKVVVYIFKWLKKFLWQVTIYMRFNFQYLSIKFYGNIAMLPRWSIVHGCFPSKRELSHCNTNGMAHKAQKWLPSGPLQWLHQDPAGLAHSFASTDRERYCWIGPVSAHTGDVAGATPPRVTSFSSFLVIKTMGWGPIGGPDTQAFWGAHPVPWKYKN